MRIARRGFLAAALAAPVAARAAVHYAPRADAVAEGVWMVRGVDAPIAYANGGAIANSALIATSAGAVLIDPGPSKAYGALLSGLARRVTGAPVTRVYITHLHPDHAMGAAAFDPAIVHALPATRTDIERDGRGFSDAMYRLLAEAMAGTEVIIPQGDVTDGPVIYGGRDLRLLALAGHSAGDLALLDVRTGTLVAGDLIFHDRAPATPHADLAVWRASLDKLAGLPHRLTIPGHGPLDTGDEGLTQTRDWLVWLEATLRDAVARGLDEAEAGELPIPERFAAIKVARYEFQRSVAHFYARDEAEILPQK